jgi:hypothetical protein
MPCHAMPTEAFLHAPCLSNGKRQAWWGWGQGRLRLAEHVKTICGNHFVIPCGRLKIIVVY